MRYVTFSKEGNQYYGRATATGIIELSSSFPQWKTLKNVIAADGFEQLEEYSSNRSESYSFDEVQFDIPIPDPGKIICVGVNYPGRNEEFNDQNPAPKNPSLFVRFPRSLVGHNRPVLIPRESDKLDFEAEIVIVISKEARRVPIDRALDYIAGITLSNEGSIRDWMRHGKFNVTQGKNFEKSGSMGPWLVLYSNPDQLADIKLESRLNGEVMQQDRTSRMIFSFARIIEYITTFTTLDPGDVILTGTPIGNGSFRNPPLFLKEGDIIEIEAEGIGCLKNLIVKEKC